MRQINKYLLIIVLFLSYGNYNKDMKNLLSKRLLKTASCAYGSRRLADIGSDHAYLAKYLLDENAITYALCVEAAAGPYNRAKRNIDAYVRSGKADVILSYGIDDVSPEDTPCVVIAGMGGNMILDILSKNTDKLRQFKRIVLQPQNAQADVRRFLHKNALEIIHEDIVHERDKFYEIICASPSDNVTLREDIFYEIPLLCVENNTCEIEKFIEYKKNKLYDIINSCKDKNTSLSRRRITDAKSKIKQLEEIIKCLLN
mgnify:CR=1 FL=1